eukprot:121630-Pleurochrysis_carterae.AAC.1
MATLSSWNTTVAQSISIEIWFRPESRWQRKAPGGERWRAAPGSERLDSARRRAASSWTAQGAGLRERNSVRRQAR